MKSTIISIYILAIYFVRIPYSVEVATLIGASYILLVAMYNDTMQRITLIEIALVYIVFRLLSGALIDSGNWVFYKGFIIEFIPSIVAYILGKKIITSEPNTHKIYLWVTVLIGLALSFVFIKYANELEGVRRIKPSRSNEFISTSVGLMSASCVVSYMSARYLYIKAESVKLKLLIGIIAILILFANFLLGSKSSIAALLLFEFGLNITLRKKKISSKTIVRFCTVFVGISCIMFLIMSSAKLESLTDRFSLKMFLHAIADRSALLDSATASIKGNQFYFGSPLKYQPLGHSSAITYPHNFLFEIYLYFGLPALFLFFIKCSSVLKVTLHKINTCDLLGYFYSSNAMIFIIYSLQGGRMTKIIAIFFIFGLLDSTFFKSTRLLNAKI